MKEVEVEGKGKGHCISQPQLCSFCKNIKALLHSTAPQPLCLMAMLADHNTTPLQGQMVSKRILVFNHTI